MGAADTLEFDDPKGSPPPKSTEYIPSTYNFLALENATLGNLTVHCKYYAGDYNTVQWNDLNAIGRPP